MYKIGFVNEWFTLMFKLIKASRGYQFRITTNGHMGRKLFRMENPADDMSTMHLFRILINWAMVCKQSDQKDEFMENWMELGRRIRDFANSPDAEEFNNQFDINQK